MERVNIKADNGYKLTQVAEVALEQRLYLNAVWTEQPNAWKQVPIAEYDAWQKDIEKLNNLNSYEGNV